MSKSHYPWCTATYPLQREVTSSYPPLGVIGPSPFIDADSRCGPPPSMYSRGLLFTTPAGLPFPVPTYPTSGPTATTPYLSTSSTLAYSRDVFTHPSSLSMGAAATVTSSSTTATTSGVTSYPLGPFAVGAHEFDVRPMLPVPVTNAPTLSSATVTLGLRTQNFVVPGADAVQGSTFPVGVTVAGVPSTTTATLGSTSTAVKSTVDGATPPTSAAVAAQSSTTSTSSGSSSGPSTGTSTPPPARNGSTTSPSSSTTSASPTSPPSSSCVSSGQSGRTPEELPGNCSAITSAVLLRSTRGRRLTN